MTGLLLGLALGAAGEPAQVYSLEEPPSEHTAIYYNARMAMREGESLEAVKLWLLRNTLRYQTGRVSPHDADFNSVTWAALGDLGVCQDGHPKDDDGAGLWPLALHNWVVRNMRRRSSRRGSSGQPRPFDAFELGRQQRFVSINDVLSARELQAARLFRGPCARPQMALLRAGEFPTADLSDRQVAARLLHHLLERSRETLAPDRVRGRSVIAARLFDIKLQLAALAAREARQKARARAQRARQLGLGGGSIEAMREEAPPYTFHPESEPAQILRASAGWPVSEWMALSPDRRLFLFDHARKIGGDPEALDRIALGVLDELIARGDGPGVAAWIARYGGGESASQEVIWSGERGRRLLALDGDAGFQERSVIALRRGVRHLESGELPEALRSMAYAMQHAQESGAAEQVQNLSRRWLSYVASRFEITDDLLTTLRALVPRRDYTILLEDMMWRAAFHADGDSFERGIRNQAGRGALDRRLALLRPLADGDVGRFARGLRDRLDASPNEAMRFLDQMLERLEREDAEVRAAHVQTLEHARALLEPLSTAAGNSGRPARFADELLARSQAILEGLGALGADASPGDRARALAPTGTVFAGSVRLAPADPLPWPFRAVDVAAPSVFTPMELTPIEWREDGGWAFGWSIEG